MNTHDQSGSHVPDLDSTDSLSPRVSKKNFRLLVLGCLGVVYGDIGTSPLYAFREAAVHTVHDGVMKPEDIYGILSLILWSLIVIVTIKYVMILLKMDNRGEGGILSLMMMARKGSGLWSKVIFTAGLLGCGLFFGDAAITPAISVLSAVEGLKMVSPGFNDQLILLIAVIIIVALFIGQNKGTGAVSTLFGPVMGAWFLLLAGLGLFWIGEHPDVFNSFNPIYGALFLYNHADISMAILGSVFLSVTGAEALYADLGHFGRKPIEFAWLRMVLPCLLLNYLGQGAFLLEHGDLVESPFFSLVPKIALVPVVAMAAIATVIASQAVITGAYSMARQAVQMGLLPHLKIEHTSEHHRGQIYMPQINKWLCLAVLLLVVSFGSSTSLASAYGIAVTGTMVVSTFLAFIVLWRLLRKPLWIALSFLGSFLLIEGMFFWANLLKVLDGGFVPLALALIVFSCMAIWLRGSRYLHKRARRHAIPLSDLMERLERNPLHVVEGTAIYMTSDPTLAPLPLLQNIKHNKIIHSRNVVLTIVTSHFPHVRDSHRVTVERISSNLDRVYAHYGFMESPDVPDALYLASNKGLDIDLKTASYFVGHRTIVSHPRRGLPKWQEKIYIAMTRMATTATDYYKLPAGQVVELGIQLEI